MKTFQAFIAAASDDTVKDSVLMSATRSIFGISTGLVNANGLEQELEVNFVEIGRSSSEVATKASVDT